jgi:MFS family permease
MIVPWVAGNCALLIAAGLRLHLSIDKTLGQESESVELDEADEGENNNVGKWCCFNRHSIPYLKVLMDVWYGIASGMTIKFFPLWLTSLGLSQIELNGVIAMQFLAITVFALLMKALGDRVGRMQVALLSKVVGLTFLLLIVLGEPLYWNLKWLCAFLQIFRTGLMNSSSGITNAVLNDFLPKVCLLLFFFFFFFFFFFQKI